MEKKEAETNNKTVVDDEVSSSSTSGGKDKGSPPEGMENKAPLAPEGPFTKEEWRELIITFYKTMWEKDNTLENLDGILKEGDEIKLKIEEAAKSGIHSEDVKKEIFEYFCRIGMFNPLLKLEKIVKKKST